MQGDQFQDQLGRFYYEILRVRITWIILSIRLASFVSEI